MAEYAKIADSEGLVRDLHTKAVLNVDKLALRRHEKRLAELQERNARERELEHIKNDITEIKTLLRELAATKR